MDLPNKEARERGFMPGNVMLAGDLIACAECKVCGFKKASSATAAVPESESEEEKKRTRTNIAILLFRTATTSCEEARLLLLASDVIES
jgi:hypothetical protein